MRNVDRKCVTNLWIVADISMVRSWLVVEGIIIIMVVMSRIRMGDPDVSKTDMPYVTVDSDQAVDGTMEVFLVTGTSNSTIGEDGMVVPSFGSGGRARTTKVS